MGGAAIPSTIRSRITRLILLHIQPKVIAQECNCAVSTVYQIQENIFMYHSPFRPSFRKQGKPRSITKAAGESLIEYIEEQPWAQQKEMVWYLGEEWGLNVHRSTVGRFLKRERLSSKRGRRVADRQNSELRLAWIAGLLNLTAEQIVTVDESNFNETTGWRRRVYAPIGQDGRYNDDVTRGKSWSILPAYMIDGYLCCGVKQGYVFSKFRYEADFNSYFKAESFFRWIVDELLPHCNVFPAPRSVIIMDNATIHCNPRIEQVIRQHGCEIRYLPPYSPDYNPIELSFAVLKAWIQKHQREIWPYWDGDFGSYLRYAIKRSRCDRFAVAHFRHSAGGYIFEADLEEFNNQLNDGSLRYDFPEDVEDVEINTRHVSEAWDAEEQEAEVGDQ